MLRPLRKDYLIVGGYCPEVNNPPVENFNDIKTLNRCRQQSLLAKPASPLLWLLNNSLIFL